MQYNQVNAHEQHSVTVFTSEETVISFTSPRASLGICPDVLVPVKGTA